MKVLLATQKPFAAQAVNQIKEIIERAGHQFVLLEKYPDEKALIARLCDVDALIVRSDKVGEEVLTSAQQLKIIVRAGSGYDNIDLSAASKQSVIVMNTPGQNSNAVAELALAMIIYMSRNQFTPLSGREVSGKKLGIHAFGNIGRSLAKKAQALGMQVSAFDAFVSAKQIEDESVKFMDSVNQLYSSNDFISVHIPTNKDTIKILNYDLLKRMPLNAVLVNTARQEIVDEDALERVLEEREDLKYVTDIKPLNYEKLREKFALRVFATDKKMGAQTAEANVNAGLAAARQIVEFFANGNTRFQVNKIDLK